MIMNNDDGGIKGIIAPAATLATWRAAGAYQYGVSEKRQASA